MVTSCAEAAVKVKKSTQCRVSYVKIDIKVKPKQSCKIIKTKLFQHPASSGNEANPGDRGQRGRGIGERKIVPRGDPAIRNVPPPAASRREQLLCGDHLWSKTGLSETGGGDLRRDRSERSSNQTSRPKSAQGHLEHEVNSPPTQLGVNNRNGGASPPLPGQQDDHQAKLLGGLAGPVFVKPRCEVVVRWNNNKRRLYLCKFLPI